MKDLRIVFMGTPEFAVASLDILMKNRCNIVGVITAPDKAAGRGKKVRESAVKTYAKKHALPILQPDNLKSPEFLSQLRALKADIQVVVAFRMLPEAIWSMPPLGTFNLHASLLPQYRGAAPINWAIIHGENETGITTFFINKEIDTGAIILQEKQSIEENMTAGELHDILMEKGARLMLKTLQLIHEHKKTINTCPQSTDDKELKPAPKIEKEDCKIHWNNPAKVIKNFVRGLCPYPAAFTFFNSPKGEQLQIKVFTVGIEYSSHSEAIGNILTNHKDYLKVAVTDGFIHLEEVQAAGKKRMPVSDFLRGFRLQEGCMVQ